MSDASEKDYVVIVQCDIVMERCSGYHCERAFHDRSGGFADYPAGEPCRTLYLTCGGCCGRALHRKLTNLVSRIKKHERIERNRIVVQLASCVTKDNYHGPPCPHLDYLKVLIGRVGLDVRRDTHISPTSESRRQDGVYRVGRTE